MCKSCDARRARDRYEADLEASRARSRAYARSERGRALRRELYAAKPDHYRALARAYARTERGRRIAQLERDCAGSPVIRVSQHNLGLMIAQMVLREMDCP